MTYKRRVLQSLSKGELFDLAVAFELAPLQRQTIADLVDLIARRGRVKDQPSPARLHLPLTLHRLRHHR